MKEKPSKWEQRERALALPAAERIKLWGHRKYVGGDNPETWYAIGRRQYHFLVSEGLSSQHRFLDIACGALRLGQFLIPMLDRGNYFGIEGEEILVQAGIEHEMLFDIVTLKEPKFSINYDFDLSFCDGYDYAMAQSLFTHLTLSDIRVCLSAARQKARLNSRFYFTFFEGSETLNAHEGSHANKNWHYQFDTLRDIALNCGFECEYIGDWGHERKQVIAVATPRSL